MHKRNSILELWRFAFCIAVLGLHLFERMNLNYFHAGYLGVEFFFIVSGYFIGAYYSKHQEGNNLKVRLKSVGIFVSTRLKRLYPFYGLALCIMLLVRSILKNYGTRDILILIKSCLAEFFFLQWTPLGNEILISTGWFVPAVFFGGLFFVLLLAFTGKLCGYFLAPVISFFIYRYYFLLIGKIDVIFSYHGVLRGMAGIGFGIFIYFLCNCLSNLKHIKIVHKKWLNMFFFIASSVMFSLLFIYTNLGHRSKWDFFVIFLYGIGLLLLMAGSVKLPEKPEKVFLFLGKITYPIYIFQMPMIELLFGGK